jgi:hypothetical protein
MSFLLLPDDEFLLVKHLTETLGSQLLSGTFAPAGVATVSTDPLRLFPRPLPTKDDLPEELLFYTPDFGPVVTYADAADAVDPVNRVARALSRAALGAAFADTVDLHSTPLIRWVRSRERRAGQLFPGRLTTTARPTKQLPPNLLRLYRRVERWLKRQGTSIDPFEYCSDADRPRPTRLGPLAVWVLPGGMKYLKTGGEVWPWTA